ncbi:MAG: toll/interleukin-1 receptor domain-containing protein [Anaerolineae bacterium]|nr:toll/interleukin-1 receptor domain-containing protein [Anaerolineae bacterium]MCO5196397.1 toll/interleukin-1 receptor domain-containing protein [Anaerolineae bacterium]MCO5207560.1 toll/interleukin-1 receptor domain-containing protein [Anaerolineae bacterium]
MSDDNVFRVKVFLSWSKKGSPSYEIAVGLKAWLPKVMQYSAPFLSSDDIHAGERWDDVLGKELNVSDFGVLCITKDSVKSPWLLFEAGVLSGTYQNHRRVVPYLLDMSPSDLSPPLGRFNAVVTDRDGTYKMLKSLNDTPSGPLVDEKVLRDVFTVFWPEMEAVIQKAKGLL